MKLYKGDCLIESDNIESGSVDLILTDLPYGTIKGLGKSRVAKEKKYNVSEWDNAIETEKIMNIANRILRKNGKMVLTANQPFTTELIKNAIPNLPHSYNMYWDKMHFSNCLIANKAPVSYVEDVLIFSKKNPLHDCEFSHPLRTYFNDIKNFIGESKKSIMEKIGSRADHCLRFQSSQFELCTEATYKDFISKYNINKMEGFKTFEQLREIDRPFKSKHNEGLNLMNPSIFNLWEGNKVKSNILRYKKDFNGHHPTQKPVLLLEDLIKTFSNEGDLVVDLTMGSGSTGVACVNTKRDFTGIELVEGYFNIAVDRIKEAISETKRIH